MTLALAFSSLGLVILAVFLASGRIRRHWRGEETRLFEREWELLRRERSVRFAIPSYKTAYYEIRPPSFMSQARRRMPFFFPSPIEREFEFHTEDPRLALLLSQKEECMGALRGLRELGSFHLISTGQELQGRIEFKRGKNALPAGDEDPRFEELVRLIGVLLDAQFDLPLNEMSLPEIQGWRRSSNLPFVMMGACLALFTLQLFLVTFGFEIAPPMLRIWLSFSIFATGLGMLWGAFRAPPHDFTRMATSYLLIFSWSVFFFVQSVFGFLNPFFSVSDGAHSRPAAQVSPVKKSTRQSAVTDSPEQSP